MASRKKAWVLLRGKLSGALIVGSRAWYERKGVSKNRLWKLMHQSDDYEVLKHMMKMGGGIPKPEEE